jgi:PD-(D/E)XK nuclease superfamily
MLEAYITKAPAVPYDSKYGADCVADALFDKVNPLVENWIEVEPHVKNERLKIHGTADAIARLPEGITVLDWKTSASKSETHPIQLAIYALCWNESCGGGDINTDMDSLLVNRGIIARVDKKSKRLGVKLDIYENLSQYYPVIQALRTIWSYQNEEA